MRKLSLVGIVYLFCSSFAIAQQVQIVGVPSTIFSQSPIWQQSGNWCWAAAVQVILNFHNVPVTQPDIVTRQYGSPVDKGGSDDQISASLNGSATDVSGRLVHIESVRGAGPPPPSVLVAELSQGRPILLATQISPSDFHAFVLINASYIMTPTGPHILGISFFDPSPSHYPNTNGIGTADGDRLGDFMGRVKTNFLVSVH